MKTNLKERSKNFNPDTVLLKVLLFLKFNQYKDVRYLKMKKEFRIKLNDCKEIKHYIKNNELDLEKIINEYSSYLVTIINNIARDSLNHEDKEEIVSEVFFILWKNKNKLDINKYLSSYIAGITRNVVKEYLRKTRLNFDIADYEKQVKIGKILNTIEIKIELNNHTNNNLLEIGKSLYQKYFENDKYTNNYEIKQLSEVTTNNRNKVDKYREYKVLSAVNTGNLVLSDDYFDKQVYSKDIGKYLNVNKNDFAYNPARINIGSIGLNTFDYNCCVSPVYVTFSVDKDYIDFFDFYFKSKKFNAEVTLRASGSVRQALNYNDFGMIEIPYPSREIIDKFNNSYIKIKNRINKNKTKIRNLEQLRDTLLPKLMNGEIDLDKVEI